MKNSFTIFSGTANPPLASGIAAELGVQLAAWAIDRLLNGEVSGQLREPVRRKEVFLAQPMAPPVNDNLVELLALADACRRAAAASITAIVPYFGYARADKRRGRCEPITSRRTSLRRDPNGGPARSHGRLGGGRGARDIPVCRVSSENLFTEKTY